MRGEIKYLERYKQLIDFSGLRYERNITPTDIDMFLDFGGKEFVIGEFKHAGAKIAYGQRLALEQLLIGMNSKNPTLGIFAIHESHPSDLINAANCLVTKYWSQGSWITPERDLTVRQVIDAWRKYGQQSAARAFSQ
jgi:hypothetical protein